MNFLRLRRLAKTAANKAASAARKARRTRLDLECLEQRDLPAVALHSAAMPTAAVLGVTASATSSTPTVNNHGGALLTTPVLSVTASATDLTQRVNYHGGAVLSNVEVQALYLGSDWATNTTLTAQALQFNSFLGTIVNSPYMDMLGSAYGSKTVNSAGQIVAPGTAGGTVTPSIGRGSETPADLDAINIPKNQFLTDAQIQQDILSQINVPGGLQMPINNGVADPNRLYVVFVEPGVAVQLGSANSIVSFLGYHSVTPYQYFVDGTLQYWGTADVHYAVIPYNGSSTAFGTNAFFPWLNTFDDMTEVISHELAESVTNPAAFNNNSVLNANTNNKAGWFADSVANESEVGDLVSGQNVYLYGYAVQRIASPNGQPMTPEGAASATPMDFVLRTDGTFWVRNEAVGSIGNASAPNFVGVGVGPVTQINGFTLEASGVASISDQGIDNFGQAMVDVVFTNGTVSEFHAGSGNSAEPSAWVNLTQANSAGTVKQAKAGQGVSYVLTISGNLYEYTDANAGLGTASTFHQLPASNVQSIDAGTDAQGVNMVTMVQTDTLVRWVWFNGRVIRELYNQNDGYEISDSSETIDGSGQPHWAQQQIATNVQSMSAGRQGNIAYVTTGGAAFWYSQAYGTNTFEADGVAAITVGTDNSGYPILDMLFTNGRLSQSDAGSWWVSVTSNVASIGKAHNGVLDLVFSGGNADTDSYNGLSFLMSSATTAA
jgi:hypothetical protein